MEEVGGGTYPGEPGSSWSLLGGCGMWCVPQPRGGGAGVGVGVVAVLTKCIKDKRVVGGKHSVIHMALPPFIRSSFYPIIAYHYTQFKYSNILHKPWASMFLLQIQNKGITFNFRDK